MKLRKMQYEENIGIIIGITVYFVYCFILMKLIEKSSVFYTPHTGLTQISYWVLVGPVVFFVMTFPYFVAQRVIDEIRKVEYIVGIKSSIIGFSLWFIVIISTYLVNIQINVTTNLIGGYATTLLVMYYMEKMCLSH